MPYTSKTTVHKSIQQIARFERHLKRRLGKVRNARECSNPLRKSEPHGEVKKPKSKKLDIVKHEQDVASMPVSHPVKSENFCRISPSGNSAAISAVGNKVSAQNLRLALAVPKEKLASKLVIGQNCTMPDTKTLLRMLKLPPNVMFNINSATTKVLKRPISTNTISTSTGSNSVERTDQSLITGAPIKTLLIPKQNETSRDLLQVASEAILPELSEKNRLNCIKREKEADNSVQVNLLEPSVEMHFECEEDTVKNIKTEPPDTFYS